MRQLHALGLTMLAALVLMGCSAGVSGVATEAPADTPAPTSTPTATPVSGAAATATEAQLSFTPTPTPEPPASPTSTPTPVPPTSTPTESAPTATPTPSLPLVATVRLLGSNFYSPEQVEIAVGGTVTWKYEAGTHNVLGVDNTLINDKDIRTGSGQTYSVTFPEPGTYGFTCAVHPATMNGAVTVR